MNKASLQIEFEKLKAYIAKLNKKKNIDYNEMVAHSYTLTGMIETIYTLMSTGAYDAIDGSTTKLFEVIEQARNLAIHYGESANFYKMSSKAEDIVTLTPQEFDNTIAERLDLLETHQSTDYLQIYKTSDISISDSDAIYKHSFLIENLRTKEKIYVPREHLVILENRHTGATSYLLKISEDSKVYYKANDSTPTTITSLKELYKRGKLNNAYKGKPRIVPFDSIMAKIAKMARGDQYGDLQFSYFYDGKNYHSKVYNVLSDYFRKHVINERLILGKFQIRNASKLVKSKDISIPDVDKKELLDRASLKDLFYIELYLKEYNAYKEKLKKLDPTSETHIYAKHALLLELYKNGPAYFSDKFINSNSDLAKLFYDYRSERNSLSHSPLNDIEKEELISNLEKYNSALYEVLQPTYSLYTKDKRKYPYAYLTGAISQSDGKFLHNKLTEYNTYKHTGETLLIGGVKYIRLNYKENPDLYIKVDGSLYVYNYYSESSYECIAPKNTQIVEIDKSGIVKPSKINPIKNKEPILVDFSQDSLFQAYNYLKAYPQADSSYFESKYGVKCAPIITIYNAAGPGHSDRLKNVLLRRNNQHFLPRELLSCCKCKLYNDINKPIEILDKNNNIIATIYYGYVHKNGTITQVLSNGEQKEIEYGESVSRSLDTSEVIKEIKLGRNKR